MKLQSKISLIITATLILTILMTGCSFFDTTSEAYTEGVKIDRDYPDDVLDIYDDAIVFESETQFDEVVLSFGTKDDFDDIVDYYKDFIEDNDIVPIEVDEERDEYFVQFRFDGYEFKVSVEEPNGDLENKYFENVIIVSSKEYTDNMENDSLAATPQNDSEPSPTQSLPESTDEPADANAELTQLKVIDGETALATIGTGSWYSIESYYSDGSPEYADITIFIKDDMNGTFHYIDYYNNEKLDYNFVYELTNGVLVMSTENDIELSFDVYETPDTLHFINRTSGAEFSAINWDIITGITPSSTTFTAYGNWVYYNPSDNFSGIMAMWEDGTGYMYNLAPDYANDEILWTQNGDVIQFENISADYNYRDLTLEHRGNVLIATNADDATFIFNRVSVTVLDGAFELFETNEPDLESWTISLSPNGDTMHSLSFEGQTVELDSERWVINNIDGTVTISLSGDYFRYYYHYSQSELLLYEPIEGFIYIFKEIE